MNAREIANCTLQIKKLGTDRNYDNILTLLSDLENTQITAEQLETTDVAGVLYRHLKTCSHQEVRKAVKSLLAKWRREYGENGHGVKRKEAAISPGATSSQDVTEDVNGPVSSTVESKSGVTSVSTRAASDLPTVRAKCAELLLTALHPEPPEQEMAAQLACDIEQHIHVLHKNNETKYKICIRSKVANLKNPKNGHLRQGLLSSSLSPEAFAQMSVEEMASPELRQLREQYSSQGVSERQLPQHVEGTQTHKIHCRRCGGSECRVTQVSRGVLFLPSWAKRCGPDEDAMTFVTCSSCGQQWYHSSWVCL